MRFNWKVLVRNILIFIGAVYLFGWLVGGYLQDKQKEEAEAAAQLHVLDCGNTVPKEQCTPAKRSSMDSILGVGVNPEDLTSKYKSINDDKNKPQKRLEDRKENFNELTKGW